MRRERDICPLAILKLNIVIYFAMAYIEEPICHRELRVKPEDWPVDAFEIYEGRYLRVLAVPVDIVALLVEYAPG